MLAEDVMETWLTEEYVYKRPRSGDIRQGEIIKVDERGFVVDLGLKRDGFIPRTDVELLGKETSSSLEPGQVVKARVVRLCGRQSASLDVPGAVRKGLDESARFA